MITGGLRLSSSSSNEFNIQTSSSSPEDDGKEIRPEKSFDKHPKVIIFENREYKSAESVIL